MTNPFTELLAEKGALLADGATGTNLFNMGLMSGDAPELWNTDEPKKIIALYKGAVDAGSPELALTAYDMSIEAGPTAAAYAWRPVLSPWKTASSRAISTTISPATASSRWATT